MTLKGNYRNSATIPPFASFKASVSPELRIQLEEYLLEKLTPDDVIPALKQGVLLDPFGPAHSTFWMRDHTSFALKKKWRHPRRWGGEPIPGVGEEMREKIDISEEAERLLQCLGLLTRDPVFISGNA